MHLTAWRVNLLLQIVPEAVRRVWANPAVLGTVFDIVRLASIIITRFRVELLYSEIDFAQLFLFKDLLNQPSLGCLCSTNSTNGTRAHKLNHALSEPMYYLSTQNNAPLKTRGTFLHWEEWKFAGSFWSLALPYLGISKRVKEMDSAWNDTMLPNL